jgi:hypothetical protein
MTAIALLNLISVLSLVAFAIASIWQATRQ